MDAVLEFLKQEFLGIKLGTYFLSLAVILAGFIAKRIVVVVFRRLTRLSEKTRLKFDDIIVDSLSKPLEWAMVFGGIFTALLILPLPSTPIDFPKFIKSLGESFAVVLIIWALVRMVDRLCAWWDEKSKETETKLDDQLVPIVRQGSKAFLYIVGIVFIIQNLGYSVTSLVAGVGLGGAALALASQDTVANVFGSIVIFFDKPFQIGDWIEMGSVEGTVEDVGLRTTRVRTFANSLVTVPNALFTKNAVNNWSRMQKRRIKMSIGVTYSSSPEKVEELVQKIRSLIQEDDNFHHDFFLVNFDNFGPSSLDIFIYCFTKSTVWAEFLQTKQEFMLKIMYAVKDLGLEFAFPTHTVYLEKSSSE